MLPSNGSTSVVSIQASVWTTWRTTRSLPSSGISICPLECCRGTTASLPATPMSPPAGSTSSGNCKETSTTCMLSMFHRHPLTLPTAQIPFQPLERVHRHARHVLQHLQEYRHTGTFHDHHDLDQEPVVACPGRIQGVKTTRFRKGLQHVERDGNDDN